MEPIPDSDFLTEQEKEDARRETNVEFIKAYNARSFAYPKSLAVKSGKDIQAFAEDKLVAKSFTEMRCELPGAPRSTFLMVFSPDGTKVASTHGNHNIYVSDVRTGKNVKTLMGHPRTPWCIAFHPTSNQIIASGCLGGQVRIWDLSGGSEVWSSDNSTVIASLTFHPEDRLLVIATYNQLHFWDWSKPEPFATVSTATTKEKVRYVAFDPLGHKLITGISNNTTPQSRWERAQRCIPSPSSILTNRHFHNTNSSSFDYNTSTPEHAQSSSARGTNLTLNRSRLPSSVQSQSFASPPRSGLDAHFYHSPVLHQPSSSSALNAADLQVDLNSSSSSTTSTRDRDEENVPITYSRLDVFGELENRLATSPSASGPASVFGPVTVSRNVANSYGSRRVSTPTPAPSIGNPASSGWMMRGNRNVNRVNSQDAATSAAVNATQQTIVVNESSPIAAIINRREPLSSVPDRERRISACYRNLVREYEQLVHRYLQIYRPPVMIDRGTDPMDLGYPTPRLSAGYDSSHAHTSAPSTSTHHNQTVNNPANIQPVSSNSSHNPTDMRAVCEFTTTDPSVLSPLRNQEVEAARRCDERTAASSFGRRHLNLATDDDDDDGDVLLDPVNVNDGASSSSAAAAATEDGVGGGNSTISSMLRNVEQALTSLRSNLDDTSAEQSPVVKTYLRLNQNQCQTHSEAAPAERPEEHSAADSINLESTSDDMNQTTSENTNQDEVNDLITNLTIISSMAVQLKSVAERLTMHKDNEEKNKSQPQTTTTLANSTNSNSPPDSDDVTPEPTTEPTEEPPAETPEALNVAADIKLAKQMVDKIVQIMNTFSATNQQQPSTSTGTNRKRSYKSNRKPILVDTSSDSSNSSEESRLTKRPRLNQISSDDCSIAAAAEDEDRTATTAAAADNVSDTTSISMYNNVAADDIASTSDFAERRPWNYNRELEQLVTDLLHDNNGPDEDSSTATAAVESAVSNTTGHTLCCVCGDTIGTCTANSCRSEHDPVRAAAEVPSSERRRRFFCHRLSAFHPTRVQTRLRHQRIRYSLASLPTNTETNRSYMQPFQDTALDEVINFSQRSSETDTSDMSSSLIRTRFPQYFEDLQASSTNARVSARLRQLFRSPIDSDEQRETDSSSTGFRHRQGFDSPLPTYHPFDPPPELDTINPEHIGIGNMYSNIVQELETSLSDIRNIDSQRRLGETSAVLSNFSERLESIMTQSHAILRNLSTSIDSMPTDGQANGGGGAQQTAPREFILGTSNASWRTLSSNQRDRDSDPSHSVNTDHTYIRPTHNMSPLMASLHLTVSHIWRQARLLRSQMDSIERIDRAMLELAQLRVMRQMFADLSRYFSVGGLNAGPAQDPPRQNRASNAPDDGGSVRRPDVTSTGTTTNTVNSMRRMMAGTRISDSSDVAQPSTSAVAPSESQCQTGVRGGGGVGRARKMYPCVLVMHPRHNRRYPNGGITSVRRGLSRARYLGSRRSVFRQMSSQIIDVAAPGRGRNYVNLLNPDTFPSLSHRLEHHLIEHGRHFGRRVQNQQNQPPQQPAPSAATTNSTTSSTAPSTATSAERLLTIRLNNCRLRMHRLFGGRTQYATNANTGPQSLVTRDGLARFNARHTLCVMLDTLSRFMEVYGTGLVGISASFRTYLREVIDLSRLLSEVLLLEIVDGIPPPTGMMLDPERQNLSQRIDDMCSRMILTRLSSQSQPLTRSLRLMRLYVRFFSMLQNRHLEERFTASDSQTNSHSASAPPLPANGEMPSDSAQGSVNGAVRTRQLNREILAQYAQRNCDSVQVRQREIQARIDEFAAQDGPEARVEEQTHRDRLARMEHLVAHVGQARLELQRRRDQLLHQRHHQRHLTSPPANTLRRWRLIGQDRAPTAADSDQRTLYRGLRAAYRDWPPPHPIRPIDFLSLNINSTAPVPAQLPSPPSSGSPSPPLLGGVSTAATENQRFLDSLDPPHPPQQLRPASSATSAFISPFRRSQQQRRLYLRSTTSAHTSLEDVLHLNRPGDNAPARHDVDLPENGRGGSTERSYPMYFRNNPMWAVPEVQVNNVPVPSTGRDPEYLLPATNAQPPPSGVHRVSINRNLQDEVVLLRSPHARAPPIFSRPRFLHPLYQWSGLNPYPFPDGGGGAANHDLLDDNPAAGRAGDQQVYESDIIAAVTPNHRIQVWEFNRVGEGNGVIPNITNALKNIVVNECKIHNDASVDIASDGSVLVTLLPSNSYLNITNRLGIYSLEWESLGQCLYITTFDQNAVSVSLSPLSRHLVVGLASRRVSIMPSEQWTLARIFLLDGRRMAFGRLSLMKEIEQSRDTNFVMSVNCIRWLPTSGQGLVFATNTGQLRILN